MQTEHLSRLCRGDDVRAIEAYIRRKTGRPPLSHDGDEDNGDDSDDDDATAGDTAVTAAADAVTTTRTPRYLSGLWGYRDDDGRTAFHWAVAVENYALATRLMRAPYCAPVLSEDSAKTTPFTTACTLGAATAFLHELLQRSADDYDAYMAWVRAHAPPSPSSSHEEHTTQATTATPSAVAAHALVNWQDELGNTPLFMAVRRGHKHVMQLLLQHGADLSHQNRRGQTVLHRAVMGSRTEVVEELIALAERHYGDDRRAYVRWVNLQDKRGDSALFYASSDENEEVGVLLLRHGANRELRNKDGKLFYEV